MRTAASTVDDRVPLLGAVVTAAGAGLTAAGVTSWLLIRRQLVGERIVVEKDASHFAGARVSGPLTAYAEAEIINRHALETSGGKPFAELGTGDPESDTVLTASFMRASLFTSVLAFGVAALTTGLGVVLSLVGSALVRTARPFQRSSRGGAGSR